MTPWHSEAQRQQVLCTGYHWENVFVGKAVVIRSFLWPGLRPRANRTVMTQLEKLQLFFFWQLVMGWKKKNPFVVTHLLEANSLLKGLVSIPVQT